MQHPNTHPLPVVCQNEDSTLVEEHCQLLVLQPYTDPVEEDAAPEIPVESVGGCETKELGALSSWSLSDTELTTLMWTCNRENIIG